MASSNRSDLVQIGLEGFAMLDEYCPPKISSCHYQYQPQKPNVYQLNPASSRTEKMVVQNQYDHQVKKKPSAADLVKIGKEGFELVDKFFGKRRASRPVAAHHQRAAAAVRGPLVPAEQACYYQHQPQKPHVYQAYAATEEKVMEVYHEATNLHAWRRAG